jgi:hypothetical protein
VIYFFEPAWKSIKNGFTALFINRFRRRNIHETGLDAILSVATVGDAIISHYFLRPFIAVHCTRWLHVEEAPEQLLVARCSDPRRTEDRLPDNTRRSYNLNTHNAPGKRLSQNNWDILTAQERITKKKRGCDAEPVNILGI